MASLFLLALFMNLCQTVINIFHILHISIYTLTNRHNYNSMKFFLVHKKKNPQNSDTTEGELQKYVIDHVCN